MGGAPPWGGGGGGRAGGPGGEFRGGRAWRIVPAGYEVDRTLRQGAAPELELVSAVSGARQIVAHGRAFLPEETAPARDRRRACVHRGAAERRGRHGRDLSAHGQHRDDV